MTTYTKYPGSKNRIIEEMRPIFPGKGKTYFEPFAGKGSVYFGVREFCSFDSYHLNDLKTSAFFKQLQSFTDDMLPEELTREDFDNQNILLEHHITILSKGFKSGYYDRSESYNKKKMATVFRKLRLLLQGVTVTGFDWESFDYTKFDGQDFIYFDPPYLGTDPRYYGQIDHTRLLETIKGLKARWALSGYENEYYNDLLGPPKIKINRRREMSQFNKKLDTNIVECIWYKL